MSDNDPTDISQAQVDDQRSDADRNSDLVEELRQSVLVLAARVHGLSTALDVVNAIQRAQQDIDKKTVEAIEQARKATVTANRAENSVVPREELDARNAAEERLRHWDRKMLLRKVYGSVLAALLICAALFGLGVHQHNYQLQTRQSLTSFSRVVYQSCLTRNHNLELTKQLYQRLIDAERRIADPRDKPRTDARIEAYQTVIDTTGAPLDCKLYTDSIYHR